MSVAIQPAATLKTVMDNVCRKRALESTDYEFDWAEGVSPPKGVALTLDTTLEHLKGITKLQLVSK